MILYDFKCQCGVLFEALSPSSNKTHVCEHCGEMAVRLVSTPTIKLEGITGHFPTAYDRLTRTHNTQGRKESE